MSLKLFLVLAPVMVGGYYFTSREAAPAAGTEAAKSPSAKAAAPRKSRDECNALERQLLEGNAPPDGNPVRAIGVLMAVERELRRQGCDTRNGYGEGNGFRQVSNRMGDAPAGGGQLRTSFDAPNGDPNQGTSFEAGRPMVDVNRNRSR